MRKLTVISVFLLFLSLTATASAQSLIPIPEFHVGGGWTSSTGAMSDNYDGNGHFVVGAGIGFLPHLELQAEYMRNYFGIRSGQAFANGSTTGSATVDSVSISPMLHIGVPTTRFGGYVTGGLGFYHLSDNYSGPTQSFTHNSFGYNIGGGVTYKLFGPARLYGEVRYHHAGDGINMVPVTLGIRF